MPRIADDQISVYRIALYMPPISELSGSAAGGDGQLAVTAALSTPFSGSSDTTL
ncbi:hypothetical protein FDG2_2306 [Candidatus Protofrankia californiensis]|uniref:Uncharacterized protein n=1 Tax=Candidatus Protofrankia californiensis TaxID=1839754 RepID=A0A1C3NXC9_9ACTN|nr:hypothetical protein FDG2_2306 [Candidatus Protofrankia californiensis]